MSDTTPKDSTTLTIGWVKAGVGLAVVIITVLSQWFYLVVQVSQIKQQSDENRRIIQKIQDDLDSKISKEDFELRHKDLQHRVDNLEDLHKPK